jgi:hypothetical protein
MYSSLVTDGYVRIFQEKLDAIGKPFKVHIETRPRKGEVYKQLVLEADESTPQKLMSPEKVLSEGEKRALALADFLTEITLDKVSQGMILDDPVTSLDLTWRQKIASIIAAEAKTRQVIVFTHDLPFLYYLKEASQNHEVSVQHHWIKKGDMDGIPGYIYPNNSPALEQDYRDASKAREHYSKAINASPQEQIDHIRLGYGALRTSYEVLIMNDLLKGVVKRFDERTSFMRLRSILWDESTVNEIVQKCELCSGMMEGHSHSDALSSGPPSSKDLLVEIEAYERLRKEARREK